MENKQDKTELDNKKPTKPEYVSFVDEMKRHIKYKKNIRTNIKDGQKLFDLVISTMRHIYNAPNKDFSVKGSKFMIDTNQFTISKYEEGKVVALKTKTKDGFEFTVTYTIKKNFVTGNYFLRYFDHAFAPKTLWGAKASLGKFLYLRNAKFNYRKIKKDIQNQIKGKERVSLETRKKVPAKATTKTK